jgi:hypothetical protein
MVFSKGAFFKKSSITYSFSSLLYVHVEYTSIPPFLTYREDARSIFFLNVYNLSDVIGILSPFNIRLFAYCPKPAARDVRQHPSAFPVYSPQTKAASCTIAVIERIPILSAFF